MSHLIFVINPGSTSTKLALFQDGRELRRAEHEISREVLAASPQMTDQLPVRLEQARAALAEWGTAPEALDMIACRAGALHHPGLGAYGVDPFMLDVLAYASAGPHASNLASMIGYALGKPAGVPVMVYDSPYADEFPAIAKVSGLPEVSLFPGSHVLNSRAMARKWAEDNGRQYDQCSFIVAHLGGGVTVNAQRNGRIVDGVFDDMGPMSPQRAGRIPARNLVPICYSGRYTQQELMHRLYHDSGIQAYVGTADLREVERRMDTGDRQAALVYEAMAYQVAKAIGELATVLEGRVDCIILTGGAAHSRRLTDWITRRVAFLAPVALLPGEREMEALAAGALRVLNGEEPLQTYRGLPPGYESPEELQKTLPARRCWDL